MKIFFDQKICKCKSHCVTYQVTIDQFYTVMNTIGKESKDRRVNFLRSVSLFQNLDKNNLKKIESLIETVEFEPDALMMKSELDGSKIYRVLVENRCQEYF